MKRLGRKPKGLDPVQFSAAVLESTTREPGGPPAKENTAPAKDPATVVLERKGGLKGEPATKRVS